MIAPRTPPADGNWGRQRLGWRYWPTVYWYELGRAIERWWAGVIDDAEDPACDYELEGAQVRHTVKRCAEVVADSAKPLRPSK